MYADVSLPTVDIKSVSEAALETNHIYVEFLTKKKSGTIYV